MTDVTVREAKPSDAAAMSEILRDILTIWKSERPSSVEHVIAFYVEHPERVLCSVAVDISGAVLGFQSLKRVGEGNEYDLPGGWGVVGTYVDAKEAGRGIGKMLFSSSLDAARQASLTEIDATIGENNHSGLAYYNAIGFQTYRYKPGAICKRYVV
jgi:L-amino acid N-acyltransferase YncA